MNLLVFELILGMIIKSF